MKKVFTALLLSASSLGVSAADVGIPCDELAAFTVIATSEIHQCSIESVGDSDVFNFEGVAGDTILLTISDTGNVFGSILAEVLDPGAVSITTLSASNTGTQQELILGSTGTYTIIVNENGNDDTDSYNLTLQSRDPLPIEALSLDNDIVISEGINPVADSDVYFFDALLGDSMLITVSDTGNVFGSILADVYNPDLTLVTTLSASNTGANELLELSQSGTYTVITRENGHDDTDSLNIARQQLFPIAPAAVSLIFGIATGNQSISPVADSDVYTFTATNGDLATLTLSDVGNVFGSMVVDVYDPQGALFTSFTASNTGVSVDLSILESGTHTILVRENGNDDTDTYTLNLQCITGACFSEPDIVVTPNRFFFGEVDVNTASAPKLFTVSNQGDDDLTSISLASGNPVFAIQSDTCSGATVAPASDCTFEVVFTPDTNVRIISSVTVNSNDPDTPAFVIQIAGDGIGSGTPGVLGGSVFGMGVSRAICMNRTTGQNVLISDGSLNWDCGSAGLTTSPGDQVQIVIQGAAD